MLKIDWNPPPRKVREFGALMVPFAALLALLLWRRGRTDEALRLLGGGAALGALTAALPASLGLWVYKAWTAVAFVIGTAVSNVILALIYYGMVTPMGLGLRLRGRDALRLRRPEGGTYWVPVRIPSDKSYFERLY